MQWLHWLLFAVLTVGVSSNNVVFTNHTGLKIVRIYIGDKQLEDVESGKSDQILVAVTPRKHHLRLLFRGGASIDFSLVDFHGVHEVVFERVKNEIELITK